MFTGTYFGKVGKDIASCGGSLSCALSLADLAFEVKTEPVIDIRGNQIPRTFNIAREDSGASVGVVGAKYTPTQTRSAFKYLNGLPGNANFQRGGMLKGGRFFLSAEFETMSINGDNLTAFGVFLSSFDGSWANRIVWILGRHSCLNICRFMHGNAKSGMANGRGGRVAKHTANHATKLDGFLFELQMAQENTAQEIKALQSAEISQEAFRQVVAKVIDGDSTRAENMREEIESFLGRADLGIGNRTKWDAFNAFSAYDTHAATRRATETGTVEENAFEALISGRGFADRALPLLAVMN
jgi:hypothetical protein